jgi:hypothetical protein
MANAEYKNSGMTNHTPLDFVFWSRLDAWSYRDAALLLCGFDPDRLKGAGIRLDGRELPEAFTEASKVYRILKSGTNGSQQTIHPFNAIEHALGKGLPLPGACCWRRYASASAWSANALGVKGVIRPGR